MIFFFFFCLDAKEAKNQGQMNGSAHLSGPALHEENTVMATARKMYRNSSALLKRILLQRAGKAVIQMGNIRNSNRTTVLAAFGKSYGGCERMQKSIIYPQRIKHSIAASL